jgi:hypothetical protein
MTLLLFLQHLIWPLAYQTQSLQLRPGLVLRHGCYRGKKASGITFYMRRAVPRLSILNEVQLIRGRQYLWTWHLDYLTVLARLRADNTMTVVVKSESKK